ncbi:MAG: RHS repeat-associated core domain-containing protein [Theionarchaea archaeon]|nr:RHS repeat-associated core domain-containing protein [Theionarchaea archaeon]
MYKPFGEQLNETDERYTYNGKELDETGLYYYGARYYDPVIGRFISRDPLSGNEESPQTLNRYIYCLNNPLKYVDPAGESVRSVVEDTFRRLEGVDPEDLEEIQKLINAGEQAAALNKILTLLGFTFVDNKDGTFKVQIEGDTWYTMAIDNNLKVRGIDAYGSTDHDKELISINFDRTRVAGDIMLTVLHEMCHGFLGGRYNDEVYLEEKRIYEVELSYTNALNSFGLVSDRFMKHIKAEATNYGVFLPRLPFSNILKSWHGGCKIC